jgi:hypothetical protein
MAPIASSLLAVLAAATLPEDSAKASAPQNVFQLYDYLNAKETPKLGVISQGNFDSVHHLVPDKTIPVIIDNTDHVVEFTLNGSVDAALLSSAPAPVKKIIQFTSTLVSPRGMFTADPADTLRLAIDAAIVRALHDNVDRKAAANWPPNNFVSVHTCRTDEVDRFPFPDAVPGDRLQEALDRGHVLIAALGSSSNIGEGSNWGKDGDYTADPPVGFWPEILGGVEKAFKDHYGVGFQRVFRGSSADTMNLLLSGDADTTEPYWIIDGYHEIDGVQRPRPHAFISSCTTLGTDSTFLVLDTALQEEDNLVVELESEVAALKIEVETLKGQVVDNGAASWGAALLGLLALRI